MKPKSKAIPLPKMKAIEVADHMLTHIERELYWALEIEASMEAANDVIQGGLKGKKFYGANTFNVVSNALAVELSLVVAKLFEIPSARRGKSMVDRHNKSDVASIPLLVRLLKQKRCRNHYASMSEEWGFGIGHQNGTPTKILQTLDKLVGRYGQARRNRRFQSGISSSEGVPEQQGGACAHEPTISPYLCGFAPHGRSRAGHAAGFEVGDEGGKRRPS